MSSIPVLVNSYFINEKSNIEAGPVNLTNIPPDAVIILFIFSVIFLSGIGLLVKGFA
jgi:TRAP-type mannitol/chloroaromatic compound transport system permease small subunit